MQINYDDERPIFVQISEGIEDAILSGAFPEESQIPSTTELSVTYKINPATALKGINLLVDNGILYKKRGIGMFVAGGAKKMLYGKRKSEFYTSFLIPMMTEAERLGISREDIITMLHTGAEETITQNRPGGEMEEV